MEVEIEIEVRVDLSMENERRFPNLEEGRRNKITEKSPKNSKLNEKKWKLSLKKYEGIRSL
jgi:hypothetical protein